MSREMPKAQLSSSVGFHALLTGMESIVNDPRSEKAHFCEGDVFRLERLVKQIRGMLEE